MVTAKIFLVIELYALTQLLSVENNLENKLKC